MKKSIFFVSFATETAESKELLHSLLLTIILWLLLFLIWSLFFLNLLLFLHNGLFYLWDLIIRLTL